nr:hypothetical protein CFP56_48709 [Quercus suber]
MSALHSRSSYESGVRPLSASETIKDSKTVGSSEWSDVAQNVSDDGQMSPPLTRSSVLSPTIPAPSPLPEDSPHKYGLRDHAETPEPIKVARTEEADGNKSQRRASGVSIFQVSHVSVLSVSLGTFAEQVNSQTATTLQSASSFLNGLSTSRRRAESHSRLNKTSSWANLARPTSRPDSRLSSRGLTLLPGSAAHLCSNKAADNQSRRLGHHFKSNGFAYARALDVTQLKCYISHAKLHLSNNKHAPVECSVCHMDDDAEHWICTWCAIRMCRYCRKDFGEAGLPTLKARVRMAELGRIATDDGKTMVRALSSLA